MLTIIEEDALWLRAGAGGEQDDGVISRTCRGVDGTRYLLCDLGIERSGLGPLMRSKPEALDRDGSQEIIEVEAILMQDKLRLEACKDIVELVPVHLNMNRADRRPIGHHAEVAEEMLDGVVGEQGHAVVRAEVARLENTGDASGGFTEFPVADGPAVVRVDDPGLGRFAIGSAVDPLLQQSGAGVVWHRMSPWS